MGLHRANEFTGSSFPPVNFRRKRLTIAVHTYFDMANVADAQKVKQLVERAMSGLSESARAKVSYEVSEI